MKKSLHTIKKRQNMDGTIYDIMSKQLQTNPIKEQFSRFMTRHKKVSIIDIFKKF